MRRSTGRNETARVDSPPMSADRAAEKPEPGENAAGSCMDPRFGHVSEVRLVSRSDGAVSVTVAETASGAAGPISGYGLWSC